MVLRLRPARASSGSAPGRAWGVQKPSETEGHASGDTRAGGRGSAMNVEREASMVHRDTKKMGGGYFFVERSQLRNVGELPLHLAAPQPRLQQEAGKRHVTAPPGSRVRKRVTNGSMFIFPAWNPQSQALGRRRASARPGSAHSGDSAGCTETRSWVGA